MFKICNFCNEQFDAKILLIDENNKLKYQYSNNRNICYICKPYKKKDPYRVIKDVLHRKCSKCDKVKTVSNYHKCRDSYHSICKDCTRARGRRRGRVFMHKARWAKQNRCGLCGEQNKGIRFLKEEGLPSLNKLKNGNFESSYVQDVLKKSQLLCRKCENMVKNYKRTSSHLLTL